MKLGHEASYLRQPECVQSEPGVSSKIVAITGTLASVVNELKLIDIIDK